MVLLCLHMSRKSEQPSLNTSPFGRQLSTWSQDGKGGGEGFEVQKYGDGRVALIGKMLTTPVFLDNLYGMLCPPIYHIHCLNCGACGCFHEAKQ